MTHDATDHDPRWVDVSGLPAPIADAVTALIAAHTERSEPATALVTTGTGEVSREHLGDVIQSAERLKAFADNCLLDATADLVSDLAAGHGISRDDPRYAAKVAAHRKSACRAVVHELQLLTGSTLTAARDRVRFATALDARVHGAHDMLRTGGCSWDRARTAYTETKHLDPVLAGQIIDRLLAPPERTTTPDGAETDIPLSHAGFRARIRRQLALADGATKDRARRHADAVHNRDACTYPDRDGTATFQTTGDAARVYAAQQRIADLARAAKAAGETRTLAQLRADIAIDLLLAGVVPGHERLGDAPAGRLHVIVDLAAILPEDLVQKATAGASGGTTGAGAAFGLGEVPGLGFLTPDQVRAVALQAGSTWTRLVTDPLTGIVIDAANTYRPPAAMARLVRGRDHTCRAPGDCGVPAGQTDLDHDTNHQPGATTPAQGATHPDNLHALHRGHHNTKTGKFWSSRQHPDGTITWHTITRQLRTTAYNHHNPTDQAPPWVSAAERHFGPHLARYCEHDLIPNVFTDLEDLHLLTDPSDGPRIHIDENPDWPDIDLPDPPPPF